MSILPRSSLLIILSALALPGLAAATDAPGRFDVVSGDASARAVQTVTRAENWPLIPADEGGLAAPAASRSGEVLWIDTNHANAIAEEVAITGDGAYGIAGWWLNNERTSLYEVPGDNVPEWIRAMPLADFQISVDADATGSALASTVRYDSLYIFDAASPDPIHTGWYTAPRVGYGCAVSSNGNTYASVGGDPPNVAGGEIRVYDGSGALRFKSLFPTNPEGVALSDDGLVVAANTRTFVKVWDAMTGALRDSIGIPGETQVPAVLSGDGSVLVTGGFERRVRVYTWDGADYVATWSCLIPSTTWVSTLGISTDGTTIVAGTWTNPTGGQVVAFDITTPTPLWTDTGYGDWVSEVALTPDGQRIAAGSWGRLAATFGPIVSVYERRSAVPIYALADDAISGVGSCFSVDISADGSAILAGGKAVHAREMGSGGYVLAIDLPNASGVAEPPAWTQGVSPYRVTPSVARGPLQIAWVGAREAEPMELRIWSLEGRLIRTLAPEAGSGLWRWDGADARGLPVAAGTYFARRAASLGAGAPAEAPARLIRLP